MYQRAYNREGRQEGDYREPYLERTANYFSRSRPGPPRGGSIPKKRTSASTRNYKKDKEDSFRERKNKDVLESYHAELKKSLLCGFDSMDEVLKAKEYENTSRTVAIPVSTKIVGISTVSVYNKAMSTEANRQRLPEITIYQLYRVFLAMVERKIFDNRHAAKLDDRQNWYDPRNFEPFKTTITSINLCTQQIGALIRCLGNFKYDETSFVPLFPTRRFTREGALIPVPEIVYLTNLRETVTSLASPAVPPAMRRSFINRNSIPGAVFSPAGLLQNADAIIPPEYSAGQLLNDVYAVKAWIEAASDLKTAREKWFTKIQLSEVSHGNESMLVSCEPENLRIEHRDELSVVEGDVSNFWFRSKMSDQMVFYGTYHLGGMITSMARYVYPAYCLRNKGANGMDTKRSFKEVVLAIEE